MFRNPRDNASAAPREPIMPSTGRPPTPPTQSRSTPAKASLYFSMPTTISGRKHTQNNRPSPPVPVPGRQPVQKSTSTKKNGSKQNQSILNFFGKESTKEKSLGDTHTEAGLFFRDPDVAAQKEDVERHPPSEDDEDSPHGLIDHDERFNELETPSKRRKVDADKDFADGLFGHGELSEQVPNHEEQEGQGKTSKTAISLPKAVRQRGGFLDDSDEENVPEGSETGRAAEGAQAPYSKPDLDNPLLSADATASLDESYTDVPAAPSTVKAPAKQLDDKIFTTDGSTDIQKPYPIPTLSREGTSMFGPQDFNENDEFGDDEFFEEGEEYLERRWMEEQRDMDVGLDEDSKSESGGESVLTPRNEVDIDAALSCPICNGSMAGLSEAQASSHVNACLDGTAASLPKLAEQQQICVKGEDQGETSTTTTKEHQQLTHLHSARFKRAAIARPAQTNPFELTQDAKSGACAFTKIMSSHAEDSAWSAAASSEALSRGKPAYQRTCPFYKILPGFSICVDAFRYGKVAGQSAYFLSHFHSDHYIGLTSSWCHGPIYASRVTCNLMRQQLRVDARWLVPLEFEEKVEVPNTEGVQVTMIPANHCPGSSLYLFEKVIGKNKDDSPRLNRVLHCGDFRACPAHVNHPLLRPEVIDAITGKSRAQSIDTCYLDTTYLTPKYAFPSQADVINVCAQMCVSLANEMLDVDDDWEKAQLARAGSAMARFLEQGQSTKPDNNDEAEEDKKPRPRGRLLVVIGTYSIGKERICLGIAKALNSKIYAPPSKMRICSCLEDAELNSLLTPDPLAAQVHMQTLMEIRAETLHEYLTGYHPHFSRVVGFRPTGWSYRPPAGRFTENPTVSNVLYSAGWKSPFTMRDLVAQRGSTRQSQCFGVPYSEHSSFRELTMFCCALDIKRVVPTVNVGSQRSREAMRGWIARWEGERKKNGLFKVDGDEDGNGTGEGGGGRWGGDSMLRYGV